MKRWSLIIAVTVDAESEEAARAAFAAARIEGLDDPELLDVEEADA